MIDTLNIGKYIYSTLTNNNVLTNMGVKTYPLVADNNATYPFIVYRRIALTSNGSKDGQYEDVATVEITIVSDTYESSVSVANEVRQSLEIPYAYYGGMEINDTSITLATEDYNNAYVQKIHLTMKINN